MNPRVRTGAALCTVVAAALVVAGCTSAPDDAQPTPATVTPSTTPIAAPPSPSVSPTPVASASVMPTGVPAVPRGLPATPVDTLDLDAVAAAFTTTTFVYDTATDVSEFDAQLRSAAYATPSFATELTTPLALTGSATFTELAAHQGFTTVALVPNRDDGQPPDELRAGARSYDVTVTGQGATDGWSSVLATETIYVYLARDGASAPWAVESVSFGLGQ